LFEVVIDGDTKRRVIAAASALFAERGFHGTTVRDIAQRARVNLAAGHYHFGSKETLYLEVLRVQFADIMAVFEQRGARLAAGTPRPRPSELRALLRTRIAAMLELLLGPPPGLHGTLMMREMCDPSAALPDIVEQFIMPHRREMSAIVSALMPRLAPAEVERCVYSIVGQVFFYRHMLPALRHMYGERHQTRGWRRAVADHIAEFSLGGMERAVRRRQRPRGKEAAR
jgi:AcrR family transcriptional regulator